MNEVFVPYFTDSHFCFFPTGKTHHDFWSISLVKQLHDFGFDSLSWLKEEAAAMGRQKEEEAEREEEGSSPINWLQICSYMKPSTAEQIALTLFLM